MIPPANLLTVYFFACFFLHHEYMSVTEISYNETTKKCEVISQIYAGDLEKDFAIRYHKSPDLLHPADKKIADACISDYIIQKLKLSVNNKTLKLHYIGYETNEDEIAAFLESDATAPFKELKIYDAILYDRFEDQTSIVHVTVNNNLQSTKLEHDKTETVFKF